MPNYAQKALLFQFAHWIALLGYVVLMTTLVPEPYMDEIFHIPQAKLYCQRIYDQWDPSITTPPGLYFLSSLLSKYTFSGCTTNGLRIHITFFTGFLLPIILNQTLRLLHHPSFLLARIPSTSSHLTPEQINTQKELSRISPNFEAFSYTSILTARTIAFFPLMTFFGGVYYTDVPSAGIVLGCLLFTLKGRHLIAGIFAILSLTFRQTNVIWIAWILSTSILRTVEHPRPLTLTPSAKEEAEKKASLERAYAFLEESRTAEGRAAWLKEGRREMGPTGGGDKADGVGEERTVVMFNQLSGFHSTTRYLVRIPLTLLRNPYEALDIAKWYLPTFVAFGTFLKVNGGIVLGHQQHHLAGLHFPQLLYFLAFATIMAWPVLFDGGVGKNVRGVVKTGLGGWRRVVVSAAVLLLMNLAVNKFTIVHPFILADNRHYFFYIWRRVFARHWMVKYALTPGYLICGWAWLWKIGQNYSLYWILSFVVATSLVLVPAPLVEPRYFLIPFIILRMHVLPDHVTDADPSSSAGTRVFLRLAGLKADDILGGAPIPRTAKEDQGVLGETVRKARPEMKWLYAEIGWYALINLVTIGLFLGYTFEWKGTEGKMRFMW